MKGKQQKGKGKGDGKEGKKEVGRGEEGKSYRREERSGSERRHRN